jgi:5'-3' exonuclease
MSCTTTVQKNISDFSGKRLAIDASGWLHKAVYTIAEDWVDSNCTDSQLYVDVIITRLKQLQSHNIVPIMVFDGKRNALKV